MQVSFAGRTIPAKPIRELENGKGWIVEALEHGPRFSVGSRLLVTMSEIVSFGADEMADARKSMAELENAMAKERETLPSVEELLSQARESGTLINQRQDNEKA